MSDCVGSPDGTEAQREPPRLAGAALRRGGGDQRARVRGVLRVPAERRLGVRGAPTLPVAGDAGAGHVIPPVARPTVCGTAARHVLAWATDGTNAATCVPHPGTEARHLGACRDRVWSWYPPVDAHGTGRLAHRGVP